MPARYLLVNPLSKGVYAWDTQTDTAYSGNPIIPDSFRCSRTFMAVSGDNHYAFVAANAFGIFSIARIDLQTLAYTIVPANFGSFAPTGTFLATNNDGSEFYVSSNDGTSPLPQRVIAVNAVTGNIRATTGYHYANQHPTRGIVSYDSSLVYTSEANGNGTPVFARFTLPGMLFGAVKDYANSNSGPIVCGLSADGTILYGVYAFISPSTTFAFVGIRLADGVEVGRYTFTLSSTAVYPVLSPDRTVAYLSRTSAPYDMLVIDLATFIVIRTDPFITGGATTGTFDATGRYLYYGYPQIVKYDTVTGTYQAFTIPGANNAFDAVLTPMGFPFSGGGGAVPNAPDALWWATGGICEGNAITLTWYLSDGATSYNIYRNGVKIATGVSLPPYVDTTAHVGTTYVYEVSAVNGAGEGPRSVATMITACGLPPTPPHGCYGREAVCAGTAYGREGIPTTVYSRETLPCDCD